MFGKMKEDLLKAARRARHNDWGEPISDVLYNTAGIPRLP
jgi:hypothetical protein